MRTNNLIRIVIGLLLSLVACSPEESRRESDASQGNIPVGFSTDVPCTRAEIHSTADISDMGVFAYSTNGDFTSAATPNFMFNQSVTQPSTGNWTYTPIKYWPANDTDKISFFAYAPYVNGTQSTTKGFPTFNYTVPAAESQQVDLLAATPLMNQTYDTNKGKVSFSFKHSLTKVSIYIKNKDNTSGKKVTAFSIHSAKSGTLTYHVPNISDTNDFGFSWTTISGSGTFTTTQTAFSVPSLSTDAKLLMATFFLLPSSTGGDFDITYTFPTGTGATITSSITRQALPLPTEWKPGAAIEYTISIGRTAEITVTSNADLSWSDGGSEVITPIR